MSGSRLRKFLRRATDPIYDLKRLIRRQIAGGRRRRAQHTTFIGITGSYGKTTTTRIVGDILTKVGPTRVGIGHNTSKNVARGLSQGDPWRYRYWVQEVSADGPAAVDQSFDALRPNVGIVTGIAGDHRKAFGSIEGVAAEKAKLVHRLPRDGLAVINADDPRVMAMAAGCVCRVVTFGRSNAADLRLVEARSNWPERLSFTAEYRGKTLTVRTRLIGTHWVVSVMAALLPALELGVAPSTCLEVLASLEPVFKRMSAHPGPNGACYVLDTNKSSYDGIKACLEFLDSAAAARKTVVFGTISDYPGASRSHYYKVARMALAKADRVFFTGSNASRVRRLASGEFAGRLFVAERLSDLLRTLSESAVPGEIIYVKATRIDRLARAIVPNHQR